MKPTKRTRAVKKPRKVTVKKAYDGKSPMGKLQKLKYRINDAYRDGRDTDKSDKNWVMEQINDLKNGGWLSATKMKVANEMWNKYNG
ncbi:uncharacterized protein METZ01_LOCUS261108 [marine metagenome]|uniref:Uncharacterized protein n=1 Tax=marine metagenome TaxID=408172 RepID=A0A382J7U1_9ZZZZ